VSFNVSGDAYALFMGRYSEPLAQQFVHLAEVRVWQRVLDVGCGPGALTAVLAQRAAAVAAVDPSESFLAAIRARLPEVDVRRGTAEHLPFADDSFDAALAQLVVHFMTDPVAGLAEMARVTRPGGRVAASVWDHAGGSGPHAAFWRAVRELDPGARDEADLPGAREGQLAQLFEAAGLDRIEPSTLSVAVAFPTFAAWWEPYTFGVGPAGAYVGALDAEQREALRTRCAQLLPPAPFQLTASAWCVRALATGS
jgi:SAM-dependent methyltransferase